MTEPTAKFSIELEDDTSGAANNAANALTRLKEKITGDTKALSEMRKAMRNLKGDTSVSTTELNRLKSMIDAKRASVGASQRKFIELGGAFGETKTKAKDLGATLSKTKSSIDTSGDATKLLGGRLSSLGTLLTSRIAMIGALVAALSALTVGTVAAVGALLRYGLAQSNARREESMRLEGLVSLRAQFGRTTDSVESMQSAIDRASDATGLGRSQLEGYTRSLTRVGLRGEALAQALEGTAIAASVQGERGARRFRAMAINAAITGRSVRDLADDYRRRLGPIARRQMLSLDNQSRRLHMGLERIFSGLRIESFLGAINEITSQFSQTTASGRALKSLVEGLFQPIFDGAANAGPIMKRFFQGMVIAALGVGIAFLVVRNAIREAIGDESILSNAQMMNAALIAGQVAVFGLVAAFGLLAIAVGIVVVGWGLLVAALLVIPAAITGVAVAIGVGIAKLVELFQETDFSALASNMIDGLIGGLREGSSRLFQQVRNLATGARDTFRSVLGISSPSTVFAGFGQNIAQGVTRGVTRERDNVNDAVGGMVQGPEGGGIGTTNATSISIGDVNVQAGETTDARELARMFRDELASVLEGVSVEVGAT